MQENDLSKNTISFGLSAAITSLLSALLVVLKESNPETVLKWMKTATVHHWVTHGLIDIALFAIIGLALSRVNHGQGARLSANRLIAILIAAVAVGYALIAGFFLLEG